MKRRERTRRLTLESLEDRCLMAFNPSGLEQEFLQLTNRFRTDPQGELGRLVNRIDPISSLEPNIARNLEFWHVNGNELARQWQSLTSVPPLAWHESLYNAAAGHNQQMISHHDQQHQYPGEPNPSERMRNAGYPTRGSAENIAAYCTTIIECHASYAIDWGPGPSGIQTPAKHRVNQMSTSYREVGIAVAAHPRGFPTDVGPLVNTQDFSNRLNFGNSFAVGAVFHDRNDSGWYDNGEGFGGATVKFVGTGGSFQTNSMTAGGYQLQIPAGTYTATVSGGGLKEPLIVANVTIGDDNVWLNFLQKNNSLPADRLEINNDFDAASPLASGDVHLDRLSIHLPDNDDILRWTSPTTGNMKINLSFKHQDGNLDLYLYDNSRAQVATSKTTGNSESITWPVTIGSTWYIGVKGNLRATNPDYTIDLDSPGGAVPQAVDDKTATDKNTSIVLNVLANDTDSDGDLEPASVQITSQPQHGSVSINRQTGAVTFAPNQDFLGVDRFRYKVLDKAGLSSQEAVGLVAVVDYANHPWRNPNNPLDIDASGVVVPLDALIIINRLNERGPGELPARPTGPDSPPGFFDATGDDFLSSIDALRVINFLNQAADAPEGEKSDGSDGSFFLPASELTAPAAPPRRSSPLPPLVDLPGTAEDAAADTIDWFAASASAANNTEVLDLVFQQSETDVTDLIDWIEEQLRVES